MEAKIVDVGLRGERGVNLNTCEKIRKKGGITSPAFTLTFSLFILSVLVINNDVIVLVQLQV